MMSLQRVLAKDFRHLFDQMESGPVVEMRSCIHLDIPCLTPILTTFLIMRYYQSNALLMHEYSEYDTQFDTLLGCVLSSNIFI